MHLAFTNDLHLAEIFQSWALGTRLVSAPLDQLLPDIRKCIARLEITHIWADFDLIQEYLHSFNKLSLKFAACRLDSWKDDSKEVKRRILNFHIELCLYISFRYYINGLMRQKNVVFDSLLVMGMYRFFYYDFLFQTIYPILYI